MLVDAELPNVDRENAKTLYDLKPYLVIVGGVIEVIGGGNHDAKSFIIERSSEDSFGRNVHSEYANSMQKIALESDAAYFPGKGGGGIIKEIGSNSKRDNFTSEFIGNWSTIPLCQETPSISTTEYGFLRCSCILRGKNRYCFEC